jgi:hypothetical protein
MKDFIVRTGVFPGGNRKYSRLLCWPYLSDQGNGQLEKQSTTFILPGKCIRQAKTDHFEPLLLPSGRSSEHRNNGIREEYPGLHEEILQN